MTEQDWLACDDPNLLQMDLPPSLTARKLRLFSCACCRRGWHLFKDPRCRQALEVAERFTDGFASGEDLDRAAQEAASAQEETHPGEDNSPEKSVVWYIALAATGVAVRRDRNTTTAILTYDTVDVEARMEEYFKTAYGGLEAAGVAQAMSWAIAWARTGADVVDPSWEAAEEAERKEQMALLRHITGNPFRPHPSPAQWPPSVRRLAEEVYNGKE